MGTRFGVLVVVYVVPCVWGDWLMAFRAQARVWWDGDVGTPFFLEKCYAHCLYHLVI